MYWREWLRLDDFDQPFLEQFQDRGESHRHAHAALFRPEKLYELDKGLAAQRFEHVRHALTHRQPFQSYVMVGEHLGPDHHVLQRHQHLLQRPVCWNTAGFYATPTLEGLRLAGTVEIAGYNPKPNPRRLAYLVRKGREMLELPQSADQEWLGFRPTLPDSLPVIGCSRDNDRVIMAFGHHHLGLTLGGITGKLVAELANGEQTEHNIRFLSPDRFL